MSTIGYARVSTLDQHPEAQVTALHQAGAEQVFVDRVSGATKSRPELDKALEYLREGDVLAVWRLDRLGRSLPHLIEVVTLLGSRGIEFKSLTESIDTTTSSGRLMFHIAGAFAQFERDIIKERTVAGLEQARAEGRLGGRRTVMTPDRVETARRLRAGDDPKSLRHIAGVLGVGTSTVQRALSPN